METIKSTQTNEKIISDVLAMKINKELNKKKTFAQDLLNSIPLGIKYS